MTKKFKHHSYYAKDEYAQSFPFVCLLCRKSFRYPKTDDDCYCPQCQNKLIMLSRKFKTPKKSDTKQWEKVEFLIMKGFLFYSVYEEIDKSVYQKVSYPTTLEEAKEFVLLYKPNAW